jgi:GMP synthase-like glutamine amidotransferase
VLGLCFGAQALAAAMGGDVARLPRPEIGWVRVDDAAGPVSHGPWFAWHEDGFTVPPGARPLGHSSTGPQAFAAGPHLALQFHPEVTPAIVDGWVDTGGRQLADEALDPEALRDETARWAPAAREAALGLFDRWLAMASPGHLSQR